MASRRFSVEARFTAKDAASPTVSRVEGRFKRLGNVLRNNLVKATAAAAVAAVVLVKAFKSVVGAAQVQEDAINKLDGALAKLGAGAQAVSISLQKQAAALQQVHGRVARQYELGQHHQVCPLPGGASRRLLDAAPVSAQIADRRIDLGEGDLHGR